MLRSADAAPPGGWRALAAGLERWLLPAACLLCQSPVAVREDDALVCGLCRSRWRTIPAPICKRCGEPLTPADDPDHPFSGDAGGACRLCAEWSTALARVRSAVRLEGGARDIVHHLKYHGWWRATESMAAAMRHLEPLTGQVCLIPIPLAPRRERDRGYNQSERLAAALGRLAGHTVRPDLLRRVRETSTQTALTPEERRANVARAFEASRAVRRLTVHGLTVVLVDDVFTTGATLQAGAEALAAAGAGRVEAVTFGRATG